MENTKRIRLLSCTEVGDLYARPAFTVHERQLYFTLSPSEREALAQHTNTKTRIYFILQLGYFRRFSSELSPLIKITPPLFDQF